MKNLICAIILTLSLFCAANVFPDGFIIVHPPVITAETTSFPLEVKYHFVTVKIKDQVASTSVDQIFYNPTSSNLEGTYIFPVPKGSVIKKFSMMINGREVEAEFLDAKKAQTIYEEIVRKQKDPALLEYIGADMFRIRVFPIEPRSEKKLSISYDEVLGKDNGTYEYTYPLNTEKFSSKPLDEVKINVNVESSDNINNIYCTSHNVDINRTDKNKAVISYNEKNVKPDTDFVMYFNTSGSVIGISCNAYKDAGDDNGYFLMNLSPSFDIKKEDVEAKNITFVLDTSGSMTDGKLDQAKKALLFCLANLNENDGFEIIRFSTEAEPLFGKIEKAGTASLKKAGEFVKSLKPMGGTNIDEALLLALKNVDNSKTNMIIFVTDGKPTIGETDEDKLLKKIDDANRQKMRIFTFGIGYEINTHLLDKITENSRSYRTYITPDEDIEVKVSNFYMKVQSPVMTDLSLTFGNNVTVSKTYPKDLPDLFKGSSINILGSFKGSGKTKVILEGRLKNVKQRYEYEISFPISDTKNETIPSLWAARRIGYLLDQIRLHGEEKELIEEITALAKKYGIITPYTSYLIIEDEQKLTNNNTIREKDQIFSGNAKKQMQDKTKSDYFGMNSKSGENSIRSSKEIQALNDAKNTQETKQGEARLNYQDSSGKNKNLTNQIKNIQGRAIYQVDNSWIDSDIQKNTKLKTNRVQFASKEYFTLLQKKPSSAQILSLGKNIRFVMDNEIYEIYE